MTYVQNSRYLQLSGNHSHDIRFLERLSRGREIVFYNQDGSCGCFFCEAGCAICSPLNIHRSSYMSLLFYSRHGLDLLPGEAINTRHVKVAYDIEAKLRNISMGLSPDSLLNLSVKTVINKNLNRRMLPKPLASYCRYYQSYMLRFDAESLDINIFPLLLRSHIGYATDFII